MDFENESDVQLMLQVRLGDERAFEALHGRYQRKLLAFFYGMSRNPHTANDLCQETFLRVWAVRARYRATGVFAGYLFGVARMIWLEWLRAQQRAGRLGQRDGGEAAETVAARAQCRPDVRAESTEMERRLFEALEALPEEQRMVFVMRTIEGLSLETIAAALDCPLNTVRSRRILAVKRLRHLLASVYEPWARRVFRE